MTSEKPDDAASPLTIALGELRTGSAGWRQAQGLLDATDTDIVNALELGEVTAE